MFENILVGIMCVIAFGAAGFGWWMENGGFSNSQDEDLDKKNKSNESEASDVNETHRKKNQASNDSNQK